MSLKGPPVLELPLLSPVSPSENHRARLLVSLTNTCPLPLSPGAAEVQKALLMHQGSQGMQAPLSSPQLHSNLFCGKP